MTTPSKPAAINPFSLPSADFMRLTLGDIRAWEIEATRQGVLTPKPDEEAWEGTEIDTLRTVL